MGMLIHRHFEEKEQPKAVAPVPKEEPKEETKTKKTKKQVCKYDRRRKD